MRLITWLALVVILATAFAGSFWYITSISAPGPQPDQLVIKTEPKPYEQVPSFNMLLLQVDTKQEKQRLLTCGTTNCISTNPPTSLDSPPLFDGQSWYRYVAKEDTSSKDPEIILERQLPDQQTTIVEQTDLVKPRGLYISPSGTKVAYWLDNIDNNQLTELWLYDSIEQGTRLVAEKVTTDDVVTRPRFNRSNNYLWFIANNGAGKQEKIELVLVDSVNAKKTAPFSGIDWQEYKDIAEGGTMDISIDGQNLALVSSTSNSISELILENATSNHPEKQTIRGRIPYVQWLEDNTLLYVVQDGPEFIFWKRLPDGTTTPLARLEGVIRSAHGDSAGAYVTFIANNSRGATRAYVLQLETGLVRDQGDVPPFGQHVNIVYANPTEDAAGSVAGITTQLTDPDLTNFIQVNIAAITGSSTSQAERIITINQPNAALVDYRTQDDQLHRLLLIVRDATHKEWTIRARYQQQRGEWQQVQGGYLKPPQPQKLYEWEASQSQWILKETY